MQRTGTSGRNMAEISVLELNREVVTIQSHSTGKLILKTNKNKKTKPVFLLDYSLILQKIWSLNFTRYTLLNTFYYPPCQPQDEAL